MSVPFFTGLYEKWNEPYIDLPEVISESPIVLVIPTDKNPLIYDESDWYIVATKARLKDCLQRR